MYTQIMNTSADIYDAQTGEFLGESRFEPTEEAKQNLLNWINYNVPLKSLVMLNLDFQPSESFDSIVPNETYYLSGVFRALVKDQDSGKWVPIEIWGTFKGRTRSVESGNFISSVEFSSIKVDGMRELLYD